MVGVALAIQCDSASVKSTNLNKILINKSKKAPSLSVLVSK
jgi:hypothetical protein